MGLFNKGKRRSRRAQCAWAGQHSSGGLVELVVRRPCGHDDDTPTVTCDAHLTGLRRDQGVARVAVSCATCGEVGRAWVDLGPGGA